MADLLGAMVLVSIVSVVVLAVIPLDRWLERWWNRRDKM